MSTNIFPAGYKLPAELLQHQKELDDLVLKAKKTRAAVDEAAAQIPILDAEAQEATAKLAVRDADRYTAEDSELKALDAEIMKLAEALDSKQRALNRAKNALIVHEARAPEHDNEIQAAAAVLQQDLICFGDTMLDLLRAELLEKIKPVRGVFAALTAVSAATGASSVRDAVAAAFVPDLRAVNVDLRIYAGTNLLAEPADPEHAELSEALTTALAPIRASLAAAKSLGSYIPLAMRPRAYQIKGYSHDGLKGDQRFFEQQRASQVRADPRQLGAQLDPTEQQEANGAGLRSKTSDVDDDQTPLSRAKRSLVQRLA